MFGHLSCSGFYIPGLNHHGALSELLILLLLFAFSIIFFSIIRDLEWWRTQHDSDKCEYEKCIEYTKLQPSWVPTLFLLMFWVLITFWSSTPSTQFNSILFNFSDFEPYSIQFHGKIVSSLADLFYFSFWMLAFLNYNLEWFVSSTWISSNIFEQRHWTVGHTQSSYSSPHDCLSVWTIRSVCRRLIPVEWGGQESLPQVVDYFDRQSKRRCISKGSIPQKIWKFKAFAFAMKGGRGLARN